MAASSKVVCLASPVKSRILESIKCLKCNKTVKNGVLCDECDSWHHFRCAEVDKDSLPDENSVWNCPSCSNKGTMAIGDGASGVVETLKNERDSLSTIVTQLEQDIQQLKSENQLLKRMIEESDREVSSKFMNRPTPDQPRPNMCKSPRGWESITSKNGGWETITTSKNKPPNMTLNQTIPLQNKYAILSELENKDTDRPSSLNEPNSKSLYELAKRKAAKGKPKPNKLKMFADSHGRGVASILTHGKCKKDFEIESVVKPNATFGTVVESVLTNCEDFGPNDFVVLMGGANDVYRNKTDEAKTTLGSVLSKLVNTNVILVNVPHRHDLSPESCVNKEVEKANNIYREVCRGKKNVSLINAAGCERELHTRHGLHLNGKGKEVLADVITRIIRTRKSSASAPAHADEEDEADDFLDSL